jgi:hypothetical protein
MPPALSIEELILKLDALKSDVHGTVVTNQEPKNVVIDTEVLSSPNITSKRNVVSNRDVDVEKEDNLAKPPVHKDEKVKEKVDDNQDKVVDEGETDRKKAFQSLSNGGTLPQKVDLWEQLLSRAQSEKPSLGSILTDGHLIRVNDNQFNLEVSDNGYAIRSVKRYLPLLKQWCSELNGNSVELNLITNKSSSNGIQDEKKQAASLKNQALAHPVVSDALEVFSGKVTEIKILSGGK